MWLGALFTSTAANFGRLLIVGLLPNAILVAYVWVLLMIGAFTNTAPLVFPEALSNISFKTDAGGLLVFVLSVITLTVVIQPFQIRLVRMLEGYWHGRLGVFPSRLATGVHTWRRARLRRAANSSVPNVNDVELARMPIAAQVRVQRRARRIEARSERAETKLMSYPPGTEPVLPTMLGNTLRRNERVAGERYAMDTLRTWPRLYPLLSKKVADEFDSDSDGVDASANLAVTFLVMAALGFVAFANDGWMRLVPAALLLLAVAAYRAAIAAAGGQGLAMSVAYDLHRFDLIEGLHLGLPSTTKNEAERNRQLSHFFMVSDDTPDPPSAADELNLSYVHPRRD
ncbi:hypothetical protein [Micromonospora humi]|uniref:Uncharacterized protein n=1 Tax=Micromonospora humi TaxID=745366 RepID=A0A1C5GLQ7_9ACTN|nr:hypothetical protein [Micromonospora humi]SCG34724.1 hypothetical protein GA0070213_101269 [Micromonospora humi]